MKQAGFSLLELSVSITILALVTGAVLPAIGGASIRAKIASTKYNVREMQSVIEGYSTDHNGEVPTTMAQYAVSNSYKPIKNPFTGKRDTLVKTQTQSCTSGPGQEDGHDDDNGWQHHAQNCTNGWSYDLTVEKPSTGGPFGLQDTDPANPSYAVAMAGAVGSVIYVPFRNGSEAQTGYSSQLSTCTTSGCAGFTSYTIQGMQPAGIYGDLAIPMTDMRVTKW